MNKQLTVALLFLLFAIWIFLRSFMKQQRDRELVEDVHSTIDFDWPG